MGKGEMFGSVVLDVVIAIAVVFSVFSLVTSGLREVVAWVMNTRSTELWISIRGLLDDPISNGLRPLREAVAQQQDTAAMSNVAALDRLERSLRDARDKETTSDAWVSAIDLNMDALGGTLSNVSNAESLIDDAKTELKKSYAEPGKLSSVTHFFRRDGKTVRPTAPVVPTIGNVSAQAEAVRDGLRSFTDALYDHPLVRQIDRTASGHRSQLTRLESGDLSGAALDLIQTAGVGELIQETWTNTVASITAAFPGLTGVDDTVKAALAEIQGRIAAGTANTRFVNTVFERLADELSKNVDAAQIQEHLEDLRTELVTLANNTDPLDLIEAGLDALENIGPVSDAVARAAAAVRAAETDAANHMAEVAANLGVWYDDRMDALTVWYRQRSRIVGFILAFIVVLGFNVDAIEIPRELWRNETVRSAVVSLAESTQLCIDETSATTTTTATTATTTTTISAADQVDDSTAEKVDCVQESVETLIESGLPVGWITSEKCNGTCDWFGESAWYASGADNAPWSVAGLLKIVGWLLAAAALSMGATFWFDVLRRAMGIKAAIKTE